MNKYYFSGSLSFKKMSTNILLNKLLLYLISILVSTDKTLCSNDKYNSSYALIFIWASLRRLFTMNPKLTIIKQTLRIRALLKKLTEGTLTDFSTGTRIIRAAQLHANPGNQWYVRAFRGLTATFDFTNLS